MVVDDEPGVLHTIKTGLEAVDKTLEIVTMHNGQECLDHLDETKPDLIILDLMMPEMNGWLTYDKIRDHPQWEHIPIIFLTARTDDIAKKAGNFLVEDYLEKPVDILVLRDCIEKHLTKKKASP